MRFYFKEDYDFPLCVICGRYNIRLEYCNTCDENFCSVCVNKWSLRGVAMMAKAEKHLRERFA